MAQQPRDSTRVLVVDDDRMLVQFVRALGKRHLFDVVGASSISEALLRAQEAPPDAVLIDLHLGGEESGLDLPQRLRELPGLANVPMGFLSGDGDDRHRIAAAKAGAAVYMVKPIESAELAAVVHRLVAIGTAPAPSILVASADAEVLATAEAVLGAAGMNVELCLDCEQLPARLSEVRPDLLILDADVPPHGAIDTCRLVRGLPRWQNLHIFVMAEPSSDAERSELRAAGADEWLSRPIGTRELLDKVSASVGRLVRLRERFERDTVTGLSLRRGFLEQAGARFEDAMACGTGFAIGLLDLDHFKQINDRYGHHTGDAVLARFGRLLQARLRPQDLRARWGGEEFCVAFVGDTAESAARHIERLLGELVGQALSDDRGTAFKVSFSAGVASAPADGTSIDQLIRCADERLYQAKAAGRSCVVSGS